MISQLTPFQSEEEAILNFQQSSDEKSIQEDYPDFVKRSLAQIKYKENQKNFSSLTKEHQKPRQLQQNYFERYRNQGKQITLAKTKTSSTTTDDCASVFEKTSFSLTPDRGVVVDKNYQAIHFSGEEIVIIKHAKQKDSKKHFQYLQQTLSQKPTESVSEMGRSRVQRKQAFRIEESKSNPRSSNTESNEAQPTLSLIKFTSSIRTLFNQKDASHQEKHLSDIVKSQQLRPSILECTQKEQQQEKTFQNKIVNDMLSSRIITSRKQPSINQVKSPQENNHFINSSQLPPRTNPKFLLFNQVKIEKIHIYSIVLSCVLLFFLSLIN